MANRCRHSFCTRPQVGPIKINNRTYAFPELIIKIYRAKRQFDKVINYPVTAQIEYVPMKYCTFSTCLLQRFAAAPDQNEFSCWPAAQVPGVMPAPGPRTPWAIINRRSLKILKNIARDGPNDFQRFCCVAPSDAENKYRLRGELSQK